MSYETTLFAHIAPRLTDRIEDVAVDALGHILSQSESARNALAEMLRAGGIEVGSIDSVQTQVIGEEGERPDLVGFDDDGTERVLIEAKFWAGLTQNQPNHYLERLERKSHGRPAALLFVAPAARLETLWPELCRRAEIEYGAIAGDSESGALRSAVADGKRRLLLTSWAALLDLMATQANNATDTTAEADIRQLRGLTARMDADAFLPWRSEDLGPEFARRMLGVAQLVDDATNRLRSAGVVSLGGLRITPLRRGYGRYIHLGSVVTWFGIHFPAWARHGDTPLWLSFHAGLPERLRQAGLADRMVGLEGRFCIPIALPTGVEYDTVLDSVVASLKGIAEQLSSTAPSQSVEPEQEQNSG